MLVVKNIIKEYGKGENKTVALKSINCTFGDHGLVVILGESGCGKSTFINMLGGLDRPTSGEIICDGRDLTKINNNEIDRYRNTYVGIVFQDFHLIDKLSVHDNIELALKMNDNSSTSVEINDALNLVGLGGLEYRKPTELSGGQRQRVALARALVKNPQILLADEPTGALDSATGEEVFGMLKKISEQKLVIVVTHNKEQAFTYADRILRMEDGEFKEDLTNCKKSGIRYIGDNIIEVSPGEKIKKEELNEVLKNVDGEKYIGISHNKDRITLAYSDYVEDFNKKNDDSSFEKTKESDLKETKEFSLPKKKLKIKDCLIIAKNNRKRFKKRYRFMTILASLGMTCLLLAITAFSVSVPKILINSTFDAGKNIVFIKSKSDYYDSNKVLTKENLDKVDSAFPNKNLGKVLTTTFSPDYLSFVNYYGSATIDEISGCIEGLSPLDLSLELIPGSSNEVKDNEVIISDVLAVNIIKRGFSGKDKNNNYFSGYLNNVEDLLGYSFSADGILLKVVGIYKTNYKDFIKEDIQIPDKKEEKKYSDCKSSIYSKLIVGEGFNKKLYYEKNTNDFDYIIYNKNIDGELKPIHSKAAVENNSIKGIKYYNKLGEIEYLEKPLEDDSIIISTSVFSELFGIEKVNIEKIKEVLNNEYNFYFKLNNNEIQDKKVKISGVIEENVHPKKEMYFSENIMDELIKDIVPYNEIYLLTDKSQRFKDEFTTFYNDSSSFKDIDLSTMIYGRWEIGEMQEGIPSMQKIFLIIAAVFSMFAFLMILSYTNQSIKYREKEIGVLRVIGAGKSDISKIFLTENSFVVIKTSIISSILVFIFTLLYNVSMGGTILNFSFVTVLLSFIISLTFIFISCVVPIYRLVKKSPVDAMKGGY